MNDGLLSRTVWFESHNRQSHKIKSCQKKEECKTINNRRKKSENNYEMIKRFIKSDSLVVLCFKQTFIHDMHRAVKTEIVFPDRLYDI